MNWNLLKDAIRRSPNRASRPVAMMAMALLTMVGVGGPADAQMTKQEIIGKIERDFGVQVLKVGAAKGLGRDVLAVTVINPPGNFNEALQVNTIAVDAKSGNLVPVVAETPQGLRHSAPAVMRRTSPRTDEKP